MSKRIKVILSVLLVVQVIGLRILSHYPDLIEKYYSLGLFPVLTRVMRAVFGRVPFSVGDVIYTLAVFLALRWLYFNLKKIRIQPVSFLLSITATLSVLYFVFNLFWGLNYYRAPLHQTLDIEREYTTETLLETTQWLTERANGLHNRLAALDSVAVVFSGKQKEQMKWPIAGFQNIDQAFPGLDPHPKSIKKSLWSLGLTYMGYSGYYNPFTAEAQVNGLVTTYKFPVISAHEMAHQFGYAAENEANFIAFLAAVNSPNEHMQYSGYLFALGYCLNELGRRDETLFEEAVQGVCPGALAAYEEARAFWQHYKTPLEGLAKSFLNAFLKANNQAKGIQSYSYMVALVVNYITG